MFISKVQNNCCPRCCCLRQRWLVVPLRPDNRLRHQLLHCSRLRYKGTGCPVIHCIPTSFPVRDRFSNKPILSQPVRLIAGYCSNAGKIAYCTTPILRREIPGFPALPNRYRHFGWEVLPAESLSGHGQCDRNCLLYWV